MSTNILLLSAYDAVSHQHWRHSLAGLFPEFQWTQLALPPRHFSWRVRGNSLSWGFGNSPELAQQYDLLIATSLVDLASLRGFLPHLGNLPTVVYFHENQFAYPRSAEQHQRAYDSGLDATMVSLYGALCANQVAFNSAYNLRTFLHGAGQLLARLPDQVPDGILSRLESARVIPVPLPGDVSGQQALQSAPGDILDVVWNHRWEYDKGPELLLQVVQAATAQQLPIRFHLLGQQFRQQPPEFALIRQALTEQARQRPELESVIGYLADRNDYLQRLAGCDVVLSTARHDFQGLAVLEASALGCTPLCPDDLVYPEYLEPQFLYPAPDDGGEQRALTELLGRLCQWQKIKAAGGVLPLFRPDAFSATALRTHYLSLFEDAWRASKKQRKQH